MPEFEEWASKRNPENWEIKNECGVCSARNAGLCCRFWSSPQDYWFKPPREDELKHIELFGGKAVMKRKLGGLLYRVYWILPVQCKNQARNGKCLIYDSQPQICRDYICEKDEFIELKKRIIENRKV